MRFSIGLPTDRVELAEEFVTGTAVMDCAAGVERLGFDACFVTDHPAPDAKWLAAGGHHALEPTVALAFAAAATTRLQLQTHIMVLAYRNPLLSAKAVLSLDRLSGGRLILGVAAGYLKPEFAALGVDFDERNELTDEAIDVIRGVLTATEPYVHEGMHFRSRGTTMEPRPATRSCPPIWIGGNSRDAIRRAVERGDGWVPFPNPATAARVRCALRCSTASTSSRGGSTSCAPTPTASGAPLPLDVCFHPFSLTDRYDADAVCEEIAQLEQLGVTLVRPQCAVGAREKRISRTCKPLRRLGDDPHARVTYGAPDGRAAHSRRPFRKPPRLRLRTELRGGRLG